MLASAIGEGVRISGEVDGVGFGGGSRRTSAASANIDDEGGVKVDAFGEGVVATLTSTTETISVPFPDEDVVRSRSTTATDLHEER